MKRLLVLIAIFNFAQLSLLSQDLKFLDVSPELSREDIRHELLQHGFTNDEVATDGYRMSGDFGSFGNCAINIYAPRNSKGTIIGVTPPVGTPTAEMDDFILELTRQYGNPFLTTETDYMIEYHWFVGDNSILININYIDDYYYFIGYKSKLATRETIDRYKKYQQVDPSAKRIKDYNLDR